MGRETDREKSPDQYRELYENELKKNEKLIFIYGGIKDALIWVELPCILGYSFCHALFLQGIMVF